MQWKLSTTSVCPPFSRRNPTWPPSDNVKLCVQKSPVQILRLLVFFLGYKNRRYIRRFVTAIRRGRTSYDQNVVPSDPYPPHAFMETSHIQVPYLETLSDLLPRSPVRSMHHFYVKYKLFTFHFRNEIFLRTNVARMIQNFR